MTEETTTTEVMTAITTTCPHVRDNGHYYLKEGESQTTTGETTAQRERSIATPMTRMTAMTTVMHDKLKEKENKKEYYDIVRLHIES